MREILNRRQKRPQSLSLPAAPIRIWQFSRVQKSVEVYNGRLYSQDYSSSCFLSSVRHPLPRSSHPLFLRYRILPLVRISPSRLPGTDMSHSMNPRNKLSSRCFLHWMVHDSDLSLSQKLRMDTLQKIPVYTEQIPKATLFRRVHSC